MDMAAEDEQGEASHASNYRISEERHYLNRDMLDRMSPNGVCRLEDGVCHRTRWGFSSTMGLVQWLCTRYSGVHGIVSCRIFHGRNEVGSGPWIAWSVSARRCFLAP